MFKLQFQIAIATLLAAVSMFLFGLLIPSAFLMLGAFGVALIAPLAFLAGALSVIYRKDRG